MNTDAIVAVVFLLLVANGAPIVVRNMVHDRFDWPADFGLKFLDRRALFGSSKTIRGIFAAVLATGLAAPLYGISVMVGCVFGFYAMLGDLFSSFIKRRIGVRPSDSVLVLDQVPESLFPILYIRSYYALPLFDLAIILLTFFVLELLLSGLFFRLRVRRRPR